MKRIILSTIVCLLLFVFINPAVTFAADPLDPVCGGNGANSAACQSRTSENPLVGKSGVLTKVVQIIVMFTAVTSVIMIMVGGFKYIVSTGDSSKIDSAKNTILYALIGLVVAVFAQVIVSFVLQRL